MVEALTKASLALVRIPQIAFEIDQRGRRDLFGVDIGRIKFLRRAEISVHGALAIRRHQNVGAAGGRAIRRRPGLEGDPGGADVMGIEPADLVVPDLADIGGAGAEAGDADNGVGGRAAGHLRRRPHILVNRRGARLVDQRHAALGHAVAGRENPHRSGPARRKSRCRCRERRILLKSSEVPVTAIVVVAIAVARKIRSKPVSVQKFSISLICNGNGGALPRPLRERVGVIGARLSTGHQESQYDSSLG